MLTAPSTQQITETPYDVPAPLWFPEVIDNTMRSIWKSCRRKFFYAHVEHLRPTDPSIHLHFGGAFARGLEAYRHAYYSLGIDSHLTRLGIAHKAATLMWGKDYSTMDDEQKSYWNLLAALDFYFTEWPIERDFIEPYRTVDGEPALEFTFAIPIPGTRHPVTGQPILYAGRFDMLADYAGNLMVEDDKTTSSLGASWIHQWKMDSQMTGYVWAARSYGYPVMGAIIRGVSILKTKFGAAVAVVSRSDEHVESWLEELINDIRDMQRYFEMNYFQPCHCEACKSYGGCTYADLCLAGSRWRAEVFPAFKRFVWNPLEVNHVKTLEKL